MSCPDWNRAAASRSSEPDGWAAAVEHFDACTLCRQEALAAEPLLVFRRLPLVVLTPAEEHSEVEAVRQAVAAMRTAERLESRRRFAGWQRWAAAAVLTFAALSVSRDKVPHAERAAVTLSAPLSPAPAPTLDGVNRPGARVYHLANEGVSVVWIVDESLFDDV
ncbi:MAG TPA: hypothetical protein VGX68_20890 [Thermoanaerobaculia bacterium]|nr:hypothetical protein [Thermoanaerobaculia bacterium]